MCSVYSVTVDTKEYVVCIEVWRLLLSQELLATPALEKVGHVRRAITPTLKAVVRRVITPTFTADVLRAITHNLQHF